MEYTVRANKTQYSRNVPAPLPNIVPAPLPNIVPTLPPGPGVVRVQCPRTTPRPGGSAGTMFGSGAGTLRG